MLLLNGYQILNWIFVGFCATIVPSGSQCQFATTQAREKLWMALGEAAPVLVPVSHVMMCMNCTSDFSLTLRRHHCNACGKVNSTSSILTYSWSLFDPFCPEHAVLAANCPDYTLTRQIQQIYRTPVFPGFVNVLSTLSGGLPGLF